MMVESDFNPEIGELVEVHLNQGRFKGLFVVTGKHDSDVWGPLLDLKRLKDGRVVNRVETHLLDYPQEERVRRAIVKVLSDCGWPEDFQKGRFDLKLDEMYDGTPRTMVYFYLKPEAVPSLERARIWSDFYSQIETKLEPYKDSSWDWLQFTAKEERSALSAAS